MNAFPQPADDGALTPQEKMLLSRFKGPHLDMDDTMEDPDQSLLPVLALPTVWQDAVLMFLHLPLPIQEQRRRNGPPYRYCLNDFAYGKTLEAVMRQAMGQLGTMPPKLRDSLQSRWPFQLLIRINLPADMLGEVDAATISAQVTRVGSLIISQLLHLDTGRIASVYITETSYGALSEVTLGLIPWDDWIAA